MEKMSPHCGKRAGSGPRLVPVLMDQTVLDKRMFRRSEGIIEQNMVHICHGELAASEGTVGTDANQSAF